MVDQKQFLDVVNRDVAESRFQQALALAPVGTEQVALSDSLGRVLADNVSAGVDVPSFDRSNYDGYAVRAEDTFGAMEETPCQLEILDEVIATAVIPSMQVMPGTAISIATGGMVPRGADAVVLVEHTDRLDGQLLVRRAVTAGFGIAFAGTDIGRGETVLFRGTRLSSRETGVLAALGIDQATVFRKPTVGIMSTGDEIIAPGEEMTAGMVFDSNARILADAVKELGGEPVGLGIVPDQVDVVRKELHEAIASCDLVVLSGGTSKGAGDICYEVVQELTDPGIVAHGVALKPGKPICLAATAGKAVVILPGFPTSAIFTFHEFVAPVIRALAGRGAAPAHKVSARLAVKVNSDIGRREFLLVGLVQQAAESGDNSQAAFPMGKGSGSVTTFSRADGFITIGEQEELLEAGAQVQVQLLGQDIRAADLVVIGSHCVGLDVLLGEINSLGMETKLISVGSQAGLEAARRGQCDLAGIHLLDEASNTYNTPFVDDSVQLIPGYMRQQGILFRSDDARMAGAGLDELRRIIAQHDQLRMVNRNQGSGTRILIDQLLDGARPDGYAVQPRSHNAVAAAIVRGSADWGVAIEQVATASQLGFVPLAEEHYDFVTPANRRSRPAVEMICQLLQDDQIRSQLAALGLKAK